MNDTPPAGPPVLRLLGATVMRGGAAVLREIDFAVGAGQHTAILGPNGSGKSSLIKLLTRELYPKARQDRRPAVEIFGQALWNVGELRSLLGIVTGDLIGAFATVGEITAREAVLSGFFGSIGLGPNHQLTSAMPGEAMAALYCMGAAGLAGRLLGELSTGEARRVLIARALVSQPRALLLDEPTAGLDALIAGRFLETVGEIARAGVTVILVTHHTDEIIGEINRVVLLRDGSVFLDGEKSVVLTSPNLTALFGAPMEVLPLLPGRVFTVPV